MSTIDEFKFNIRGVVKQLQSRNLILAFLLPRNTIKRFFSIEIYEIDRHSIKPNNSENSKARQFQKLFGFVQDKSLDPMKVIFKVRGSGYGAVGKAINTSSNPVPSPSSFLLNAVSF